MRDEDWMAYALREAELSLAEGEIPVGAVLVRENRLIARAHNRREALHDPTAHAEILCLREAGEKLGTWRLTGCTLYVTLEPCPMCAGAMLASRLSRCVYGARDPRQGCCGSVYDLAADPLLSGSLSWHSGVLCDACASLLAQFFTPRRST